MEPGQSTCKHEPGKSRDLRKKKKKKTFGMSTGCYHSKKRPCVYIYTV